MNELERRRLLKAAGAAGVAVPLLAACGGEDGPESGNPQGQDSQDKGSQEQGSQDQEESTPTSEPSTPEDGSEGQGATEGKRLAATSDIPVGGGKIFQNQKVVVTQPAEGDFKGFSAVCTHNRCTVAEVAEGTINCPCHGSRFKVADGSVANGPATQPLEEVGITVEGDAVMLRA